MITVFTPGCFDIIHYGHIELFKYCRSIGDRVIVGLNSDSSIRKIKGASRPINNLKSRLSVLEAIKYIDEVIVFDEEDPYRLIKSISPNVIVKGGDYKVEDVIGNDLCDVKIFKYIDGYSTTKAIQRSNSR